MTSRILSTIDLPLVDPTPRLNVLDYAAGITINDGGVHTVSTAPVGSVFHGVTTLAGLAAISINGITPFAFLTNNTTYANGVNYNTIFTGGGGYYALTNTNVPNIDIAWLAIQAAFLQGPCRIPSGTYIIGSTLALTLMIPDTGYFPGFSTGTNGITISIRGDGQQSTTLQAGSDFGSGFSLLCCGDPAGTVGNSKGRYGAGYTNQGMYLGDISDLQLMSSNTTWSPTATTIGTKPVNMTGFAWGARLQTNNITCSNFNKGWSLVGDHSPFGNPKVGGCYYGFYWDIPSANLFGALQFSCMVIETCFAGMAAYGSATISGNWQGETYVGGCTYPFFGEAGNGSAYLLSNATFQELFCEFTGLAVFHDDNVFSGGTYTDANKLRGLGDVNINKFDSDFSASYAYTSTGRYRRAWADVNQMDAVTITNLTDNTGALVPTQAGSTAPVAFINALEWGNNYYGCHFAGAMPALFVSLGSLPFWHLTGSNLPGSNATWACPGESAGRFFLGTVPGGNYATTLIGDVFETATQGGCAPGGYGLGNNNGVAVIGTCMQTGVNITSGINGIPIATSGFIPVNTGPISYNNWTTLQRINGIGALTITSPGSGGTNGTFAFGVTGGGGSALAGTFTVAGGVVTAWTITNVGTNFTSVPTITTANSTGLTGAVLTPKWPGAIASSGTPSATFGQNIGYMTAILGSSPNYYNMAKATGLA